MPVSPAILKIHKGSDPVWEYSVNTEVVTIGRATNSDLVINDPLVSRQHAQITRKGDRYQITDCGSTDGTRVNNILLKANIPHFLANGDTISIGNSELRLIVQANDPDPTAVAVQKPLDEQVTVAAKHLLGNETVFVSQIDMRGRQSLTIGRDSQNDTAIGHPSVSRFHARLQRQSGSVIIKDLNSTNGTYVNGRAVKKERVLKVNDSIRIGPCRLVFNVDETFATYNEEGNLRLDAVHLTKVVGKGTKLLNDISLSIKAREFVAIAGVSGGGKSTLLDALNGFRPATSGSVLVNGVDLYKNFNAYRNELGYVPQKDIIHLELTIEQALDYAAQLRMPADSRPAERKQRVKEVLEDLGLTHRKDVQVKALSGGQLKRVSIGVELLTKPSLFFLDEATSGLDPGTEVEIMQLLRQLADQGRTVLLITHATENVTLCDLVIFMAAGGRVAYCGPPQEAPTYFGVQKFNEIYRKVEREESPDYWQQRYLQSAHYQKYVVERQLSRAPAVAGELQPPPAKQPLAHRAKRVSALREFAILSQRNLAILIQDKAGLFLMLAVAPTLGLLDFVTWKRDLFSLETGDAGQAITMLFVTALIAVMVGSLATMREIVKENDIYRRERMIGLQIIPYILSKVWVGILLALYQAGVFLLFKKLAIDLPGGTEALTGMYVTLFLASIAGMMMGLFVSALSPNQNIAPLLTIIFLVPQITFGGGMLSIEALGAPGRLVNQITITKWSFESLLTQSNLGSNIVEDPCWQLSKDDRNKLSQTDKKNRCECLGEKLFKTCQFPGIKGKYDPVLDQTEPAKPQDPGKVPDNPAEFGTYQEKVDNYKAEIDSWQTDYSEWKGKYEGTIKGGEALLENFYNKYGSMFKVNVRHYWAILCLQILALLGLTLVVQKRKDIV